MNIQPRQIEIYKSAMLTIIAIILAGIWLSMPRSVTVRDLRSKKNAQNVPVVYVRGGNIDVDNTLQVEVENTVQVEVGNTVEVEGTVSVEQ